MTTETINCRTLSLRLSKRMIVVLVMLTAIPLAYVAVGHFAIHHRTLALYDQARKRAVPVDLALRWDYQLDAAIGLRTLPVALISQGNTVKNTEYSFLANDLASRGFLVASIQHDLPTDPPLMTTEGSLYVGRLAVYTRAEANILFVIDTLKKMQPHADYSKLTLIGHSNGGDISMFFAQQHPELVARIITLDNLRVPFVTGGNAKILSFRSDDPAFKTDPGVLPTKRLAKESGIDIVQMDALHTDMSDRGPDSVKESIQSTLDKFLGESDTSKLGQADTSHLIVSDPLAMGP